MTDAPVVLITGSRSGIGEHLCHYFVANGALVEGCSRHQPEWELNGYTHHVADVGIEADVVEMMDSIRRRHGRLDILVNNAAVASMNHSLLTPTSSVDSVLATNIRGTFLCSREGAKLMRRRNFGRIISIGTVIVPLRLEGESVYAASKSAVLTLMQVLARELAPFGITCNVVAPTVLETEIVRGVPRAKLESIVDRLAIKRMSTFDDIANVIDFFAAERSSYVTGQVIYLGGV